MKRGREMKKKAMIQGEEIYVELQMTYSGSGIKIQ